jgi:hypothetical protein
MVGRGFPSLRIGALAACLAAVAAWGAPPARAQVVINEVLASNLNTNADEDGDSSDWVELYNRGKSAVDLKGFGLSDDGAEPMKWRFPEVSMAPGSYLLVWCSDKDRTTVPEDRIAEPNSPLPFSPELISLEDEWRYLSGAPTDAGPPVEWKSPDFDDAGWPLGRPGFGFGAIADIRTAVPAGSGPIFLRRRFDYQPGGPNLVLQVAWDDGFVAYLNGVRVASDRFAEGAEPTFASLATGSHSSRTPQRFDLSASRQLLRPGANVLAIAVFNQSAAGNDLAIFPELGVVPPILHTNFKLSADGETVLLVAPSGEIRDEVSMPPQVEDHSYGRSPNGSGPFLYHRDPTPLAANDGPAAAQPLLVSDTTFSHDRGFYDAPFEVAIATSTADAEIRYTLDGSVPTESNGTLYLRPIPIEGTTTLRARAFKAGFEPTNVDTQTYIFLDDVVRQNAVAAQADGFPRTWGATAADYDMDTDVIGPGDRFGGIYAGRIRDDLKSLPSMSIVMLTSDLFGPQGIYTNSTSGGLAWERAASVELISPDGGPQFQVDCGIRIQGGYFRQNTATRKHSFRLLFKREYGATKLEFPLFGDDAVDRFDTITLRAGANDGYSWDAARLTEQYTRDQFGRDLQGASGNAASHGIFVHLYVNGLYWGLYNPAERPDHSFSASYYGGDKEEWDSVHDGVATNGDLVRWNEMLRGAAAARTSLDAFQQLQGRNPDGSPNPEFPHLLDVPNYVDYLIVNLWGGNWDWPWKNWWAGRSRAGDSTGFKFYSWDYENTIGNNRDRSPLTKNALQNNFSSAGEPHQSLRSNPEYRLLFADRIHRLLFNGGPLTPESLSPRYEALAARVEGAIVAESARWGDQHHNPPLTLREWTTERDWILRTYLPQRTAVVLQQFRGAALYPSVEAPVYSRQGGLVPAGYRMLPRVLAGTAYYTADGSDPRLPGGEVSPAARVADTGTPVVLLPAEAPARIHVPADGALGLGWTAPDFDDSAWLEGRTAVGFETDAGFEAIIATDVGAALHNVNASIYLRLAFEAADPSALVYLTLRMRYDDGFVAYLNGERVAERRAPATLSWNSQAASAQSDRAALEFEAIDLAAHQGLIRRGRNLLAFHALNARPADGDFLIQPELVATDPSGAGVVIERSVELRARTWLEGDWSALNEAAFVVDSGIPLRVTELMYHPAEPPAGSRHDADEFEFIELRNAGAAALDLSQVKLRGGVEFDFAASDVEVLGPGEHVLLVENLDAFRERYGAAEIGDALIAGEYSGRLSNGGDRLILEGFLGEPILEFEYDDAWYPETDGEGGSLVIVDAALARERWGEKESWRPSERPGGSPGSSDGPPLDLGGLQRPGDASQDGRLNVADVMLFLRALFLEAPAALPCDGDSIAAGGNRTLHDVDSNGAVNLSDAVYLLNHLYRRGAPPALGSGCVRIRGCQDACER